MPHAESFDSSNDEQAARDNALIAKALSLEGGELGIDVFNRELDKGEKADDAIDYEDISDDDLAEDEDEAPQRDGLNAEHANQDVDMDGDLDDDLFGGDDVDDFGQQASIDASSQMEPVDELDDLFGGSSPQPELDVGQAPDISTTLGLQDDDEIFGEPIGSIQGETSPMRLKTSSKPLFQADDTNLHLDVPAREEPTEMELLQQRLFALSNHPPAPPENQEELLASLWPKFERDTIPRFMDLLPPKNARFIGKVPTKVPKPVNPTKISLELASDQEKSFKISAAGSKRTWDSMEEAGLVTTRDVQAPDAAEDDVDDGESDYENEPVGGVSWEDFQVVCEDWDIASQPESEPESGLIQMEEDEDDVFADLFDSTGEPVAKRQKLGHINTSVFDNIQHSLPSLADPESATKRIARAVTLDLNDPHLLIDENYSALDRTKRQRRGADATKGGLSKTMQRRYNISNDDAYELLKENHQSRIRSTLGQPTITHSMPAARLQWPYYKTKLMRPEARSFHRPAARFTKGEPIAFQKPPVVKRKHTRGKDAKTLFNKTEDLSLRDNSHLLLLEYSEEHPDILSNFGMGSRVINYYRKKNLDDSERPKLDIGELSVLLPQDKSPFSVFGHIDPGNTTPAIYNGLYRAPIFEQKAKSTDFLMIRNSTGADGGRWYMREIEYLRVVGQLFPSQEVPRPNGRKVSTAAKNRIKMIAYRLMRREPEGMINVQQVTNHVADAAEMEENRNKADMQSRQKMKEFLSYNKDAKLWGMPGDQPVPDEDSTRSALPPEDACLVEAVQVGQQRLEDAGFTGQDEDGDDDGDENQGKSIEEQLAPWLTTKNFLTACAGKAMLQLHGEGDPSGRGEAFSFLKTSMKGGFKALGESVEDKIDAKKLKENNGHSYNVARQAKAYEESIRRIWDKQHDSLSATVEHSDMELDIDDPVERAQSLPYGATPRSEAHTPSVLRRGMDDDSASQFSKFSTGSNSGRVLRIVRKFRNNEGGLDEREEIIRDPKVIKQYQKRKAAQEAESIDLDAVKEGDIKDSAAVRQKIETELIRLERNKERRLAREKQKAGAAGSPGSPTSAGAGGTGGGRGSNTTRRCANCGQVGHIKTNKKLCPLLNGTAKPQDSFGESAFSSSTPAP